MDDPGPYIQTVSGRRVNPLDPSPADIDVHDIAVALSNQCRFGGHTRRYYSVAQHACIVSDQMLERGSSAHDALWGLLHDASEAYLVDLPHPLKHRSELGRQYREAEGRLEEVLLERFGLLGCTACGHEGARSLPPRDRARHPHHGCLALARARGRRPARRRDRAVDARGRRSEFLERYERLEAQRA